MYTKVLTSIDVTNERKGFIIGTHNGVFHSGEVVAIAILCLLYKNGEITIIRTRDQEILSKCDIAIDVGGGNFDHNQKDFNKKRKNGIAYASAGLIWRTYGQNVARKFLKQIVGEENTLTEDIINIWKNIDNNIMSLVDLEENRIEGEKHPFNFISLFLPLWYSEINYEKQFENVLEITIKVLEQQILNEIGTYIAKKELKSRWQDRKVEYFKDNILEIPSQVIPWVNAITSINKSIDTFNAKEDIIQFIIFPYIDGGWAAQCVPFSLEEKYTQRIPFPKEWVGQTDKLSEISEVKDAISCDNDRSFVRAGSKEGVIELCLLAMRRPVIKN